MTGTDVHTDSHVQNKCSSVSHSNCPEYILRWSLISANSLVTSWADTLSICCICMTLQMLSFNVFNDIDECSQDLTRHITLNLHSAVADPSDTGPFSVIPSHIFSSWWIWGKQSLELLTLFITSQIAETLVTLVTGAGEFLLCSFRYTGSSWTRHSWAFIISHRSMISDSFTRYFAKSSGTESLLSALRINLFLLSERVSQLVRNVIWPHSLWNRLFHKTAALVSISRLRYMFRLLPL